MTQTLQELIMEAAKRRYHWTDTPSMGFGDNTVPKAFLEETDIPEDLPLISPNLQQMFGGEALTFSEFVAHCGINMIEVASNLQQVKKRQLRLLSVGYGGASINLLHFIGQFAIMTGISYPFQSLIVYEEDTLSLMNALRVYKPIAAQPCDVGEQNKMVLLSDGPEQYLSQHIYTNNEFLTADLEFTRDDGQDTDVLTEISNIDNLVFFGAPDFKARTMLQDNTTKPFLFIGHGDNEVDIYRKPHVDGELTVESYGKIDLSVFFINMLHASAAMLGILARGEEQGEPNTLLYRHNTEGM